MLGNGGVEKGIIQLDGAATQWTPAFFPIMHSEFRMQKKIDFEDVTICQF